MSENTTVNSQILDSVEAVSRATMPPSVPKTSGRDKATQAVAQSAAMAIQDATDNLRNSMTIGTTAIGVAMSELLATGGSPAQPARKELGGAATVEMAGSLTGPDSSGGLLDGGPARNEQEIKAGYGGVIGEAQGVMTAATKQFADIGKQAAYVLNEFTNLEKSQSSD